MLHKAAVAVVLGLMMAAPSWAADGPFGIAMGLKREELSLEFDDAISTRGEKTVYSVIVPKPNSQFASYMVTLSPETGVCELHTSGGGLVDDVTGARVSQFYLAIKKVLTEKYGPPTKVEEGLISGATLTRSEDFALALRKEQRQLSSEWHLKGNSADIGRIHLYGYAANSRDTYIAIVYQFENYKLCANPN